MRYRILGKTGLKVSEIGVGAEWFERHTKEECVAIMKHASENGINIIDCWMPGPQVRSDIGEGLKGCREKWIVQGHIGSTWQNGQYVKTRDMSKVKPAFEDLLKRLGTDYIDLGMIHYVDKVDDWNTIMNSEFIDYVKDLKAKGIIKHIGMSTHNPRIGKLAIESGIVEMMMFSVNAAFDLQAPTEDLDVLFREDYEEETFGQDPERAEFYKLCEQNNIGLTVMKPYAGGRLLDEKRSPLGVALTPVECIHYCLTRPAVCALMIGYDTPEHVDDALRYETATEEEKNYAQKIANAPRHSYRGQCTYCGHCKPCPMDIDIAMVNKFYDLATMQEEVPASVKEHYLSLDVRASSCIGCQSCEERCPFGVKISERMTKAAELFGE
jgi:hypothetical protein